MRELIDNYKQILGKELNEISISGAFSSGGVRGALGAIKTNIKNRGILGTFGGAERAISAVGRNVADQKQMGQDVRNSAINTRKETETAPKEQKSRLSSLADKKRGEGDAAVNSAINAGRRLENIKSVVTRGAPPVNHPFLQTQRIISPTGKGSIPAVKPPDSARGESGMGTVRSGIVQQSGAKAKPLTPFQRRVNR